MKKAWSRLTPGTQNSLMISMFLLISSSAVGQSPHAFGIPSAASPNPGAGIVAVTGSRAQGYPAQGRSEVIARHGVVATSDPLAAQAGLDILRQGGNAIDAAVAASAVLDVTSQNDTGLAGDLFALVWSARDKKLYALNSAGWAPAGWTPDFFRERFGVDRIPLFGVNSATVPGAVSGYDALLERFGTMDFRETLESAARLAEDGWGLAERRHNDLRNSQTKLLQDPDSAAVFLNNGEVPPLYSIIRNPGLADALRLLQEQGREAFYKGPIADAIVAKVQAQGGVMNHADLAEFASEWVEPISTSYHGYDIFELPPPGQDRASTPSTIGGLDGGTIYLTTADRWGNMVSLIHSIYSVYGSGITIPPYGMMLHNRGTNFSLDATHPNVVAPRKRPFHSIIAGFVRQEGKLLMTFGNMGGSVQPETHAQHMVNLIDHGMNVQMTADVARFTHNQTSNVLALEDNLYHLVGKALSAKGHVVTPVDGGAVGGYQGILFIPDPAMPEPVSGAQDQAVNGVYRAGSDHRKDGQAVGW